jgi:hypothetical protein
MSLNYADLNFKFDKDKQVHRYLHVSIYTYYAALQSLYLGRNLGQFQKYIYLIHKITKHSYILTYIM